LCGTALLLLRHHNYDNNNGKEVRRFLTTLAAAEDERHVPKSGWLEEELYNCDDLDHHAKSDKPYDDPKDPLPVRPKVPKPLSNRIQPIFGVGDTTAPRTQKSLAITQATPPDAVAAAATTTTTSPRLVFDPAR